MSAAAEAGSDSGPGTARARMQDAAYTDAVQAALFASAAIVVAPHGAALHSAAQNATAAIPLAFYVVCFVLSLLFLATDRCQKVPVAIPPSLCPMFLFKSLSKKQRV